MPGGTREDRCTAAELRIRAQRKKVRKSPGERHAYTLSLGTSMTPGVGPCLFTRAGGSSRASKARSSLIPTVTPSGGSFWASGEGIWMGWEVVSCQGKGRDLGGMPVRNSRLALSEGSMERKPASKAVICGTQNQAGQNEKRAHLHH